MADIRREFLMIKLKSEVNKNRFCFGFLLERLKKWYAFDTYFWISGKSIHFKLFDPISLE